jgi:glycosyltransferase involved in cell wall biosynthesis
MHRPKVSIIVPIYNVEKYIRRCLESILNQTLEDIEIILVDDGSPDLCPQICDEYALKDERIKVLHKNNEGLGFARNSGMKIAVGEFIAFVDSDDYVEITMYEELYNRAKKYSADSVFCGFNYVDDAMLKTPVNEVKSEQIFNTYGQITGVLLNMIGTSPREKEDRKFQMSVWHAIYSRTVIEGSSIIFPSEREFISEDIFFHIQYFQNSRLIVFIPNAYYNYCANGTSLSSSYRSDRFLKYKILHKEISNRLQFLNTPTDVQHRVDRLFIGYSRSLIFQIAKQNFSLGEKIKLLRSICRDPIWHVIFNSYPYWLLPLKYRLIALAIKMRLSYVLLLISKLKV